MILLPYRYHPLGPAYDYICLMDKRMFPFLASFLCSIGLSLAQAPVGLYYDFLKISQTAGWEDNDLIRQEAFGSSVATAGDLNGDLVPDLLTASFPGGQSHLRALYLNRLGEATGSMDLAGGTAPLPAGLTPGGFFGAKMLLADWNGDGIKDLWVGEPMAKLGPLSYGQIWLGIRDLSGKITEWKSFNGRTEGLSGVVTRDDLFGSSLALVPDLDLDGRPELAVGAPGVPEKSSGYVYLLYSGANFSWKKSIRIQTDAFFTQNIGDQFGAALSLLGDLNGDGKPELAIGAPGDNQGAQKAGAIYIVSLEANGTVAATQKWFSGKADFKAGMQPDDRLGNALATLPDQNNDGLPELAAGAFLRDDTGKDKGAIYMFSPDNQGNIAGWYRIAEGTPRFDGEFPLQYQWATDLCSPGDIDEDGMADLAVGAPRDSDGGGKTGAVWVLFPRSVSQEWIDKRQGRFYHPGTIPGGYDKADSLSVVRLTREGRDPAWQPPVDSLALDTLPGVHLVLLLDVSASMDKPGKLPLLRDAFIDLLGYMRPRDKVSVIIYAKDPTVILAGESAANREAIADRIAELKSSGETLPAKALKTAYELAEAQFIPEGNNRILFATDGAFPPQTLDGVLEKYARPSIPLDLFYFGKVAPEVIRDLETIAGKGKGSAIPMIPTEARSILWNLFAAPVHP